MPASRLDALLEQVEESLKSDLVLAGIFNDAEIFRAEIGRIFTRGWAFVAHESEIASQGDFMLWKIGWSR